jgi:pimeloyl-ACP methyl ester carboxylesterase
MKNLRTYGSKPFNVAVIHGGPGAPGEMAPVARELSGQMGMLEPLQTAASLEGQVQELQTVLKENGDLPLTLIGWSWGAVLSFIVAARYPPLVRKLILVDGAAFEEKYAEDNMKTRLSRLTMEEGKRALFLMEAMNAPAIKEKGKYMIELGRLVSKVDSCDPLPHKSEVLKFQHNVYQGVWPQVVEMRKSGKLLRLGEKIQCPVVAIHGDYDPHPAEGVRQPLSRVLKDFRFILLEDCGHQPWIERAARDKFYSILRSEIDH